MIGGGGGGVQALDVEEKTWKERVQNLRNLFGGGPAVVFLKALCVFSRDSKHESSI